MTSLDSVIMYVGRVMKPTTRPGREGGREGGREEGREGGRDKVYSEGY